MKNLLQMAQDDFFIVGEGFVIVGIVVGMLEVQRLCHSLLQCFAGRPH
jgi:hypothetical protein